MRKWVVHQWDGEWLAYNTAITDPDAFDHWQDAFDHAFTEATRELSNR
jgi:hypothetical protein